MMDQFGHGTATICTAYLEKYIESPQIVRGGGRPQAVPIFVGTGRGAGTWTPPLVPIPAL